MAKAILFDSSKCMACRGCQVTCKNWWELSATETKNLGTYENPPSLNAKTWNKMTFTEKPGDGHPEWDFVRQSCMHCTEATCVYVCPTFARQHNEEIGSVWVDHDRCIGCGRCVIFCPFSVPRLGSTDTSRRIDVAVGPSRDVAWSCLMCPDRIEDGIWPACAKTCPPKALKFGERDEMLAIAHEQLDKIKSKYPNANIYGETELGGLHLIMLLKESPEFYGMPLDPQLESYPEFDAAAFPKWYVDAIDTDQIPAFPENAKAEWYMQPDLKPEAAPGMSEDNQNVPFGVQALIAAGATGAAGAIYWFIRRRASMEKENSSKS